MGAVTGTTVLTLALLAPAQEGAGRAAPSSAVSIVVQAPLPRDGVWDSVAVSATAPQPGSRVRFELRTCSGKLLAQTEAQPSPRPGGPSRVTARLPVPVSPGSLTGKLVVRQQGAASAVEVPLVFQRAVAGEARRLLRELERGETTLLKQWAGRRIFGLVVEGSRTGSQNVEINARSMRPLLQWARRHRKDAVRRVSVSTNAHLDGYSAVTLQLTRGFFDVGVTFDGRLNKIFATRRGAGWD
jgi:hypothetical protein